ncbi:MAG: histidine phosphatase family protein [Burkholderiales bacterium]|nr:MAG: histidine phosphatase family protein [Burkholderiales bacterium]
MELILWRHAQAEDGSPDAARRLTSRGAKDAAAVGTWLRRQLGEEAVTVLSSPTTRTMQTAQALGLAVEPAEALGPEADVDAVLAAAGWPSGRDGVVIVVGHGPWIGEVAARLLTGRDEPWPFGKGALWWFGWAKGDAGRATVRLKAVLSPELLR